MKCQGDPACPFPALLEGLCGEHWVDARLPFTLHEMNDRVRCLEEEGDLWQGFSKRLHGARRTPVKRKLKMTEEERRNRYCNTYCQALSPEGVRCNARIPVNQKICDECKERLLPTKKEEEPK